MKTIQTAILAIAMATFFASCESASSQTKVLSNAQSRHETMQAIANDSMMAKEMIHTMMDCKNGAMMMGRHGMMSGNQNSMMKMMQDNPGMMQPMLSAMMENAKGDSSMMSGMINTMESNPQMMRMMQDRTGKHMNGMHGMGGMGR